MKYVIDGNAFLNVAYNVVKNILSKDRRSEPNYYVEDLYNEGQFVLTEEAKVEFRNFCVTYFNSIIAPIGRSIDEVHFVFDSRSWRRDFIEGFFQEADTTNDTTPNEFSYKGDRKYDDKKFLFFDYFQRDILIKLNDICGINYYRLSGCEGDDIIAYLCEHLDGDIVIYTVDLDLQQLVDGKDRLVMLVMPKQMSRSKKLFSPDTYTSTVSESEDFFSLEDTNISDSNSPDRVIKKYCQKGYVDNKINPDEELIRKILGGDKSDKIPRLYKMTKSKVDKLTAKLLEKYKGDFTEKLDVLDTELLDYMIEEMVTLNKIKDENFIEELRAHLIFNIKLIRLSTKVFPDDIKGTLDEFFIDRNLNQFSYDKFLTVKNNPILI
jgi:hypothetical protein